MSTQFALDLRIARRKAGLSLKDCGHLLDVHYSTVAALERGQSKPSLEDICTLSYIYGRSFESLYSDLFANIRRNLKERLAHLPDSTKRWLGSLNRKHTLNNLAARLNRDSYGEQ